MRKVRLMLEHNSFQQSSEEVTPFLFVLKIAQRIGITIPDSEDRLCSSEKILDYCVDTLLVDELCHFGLNEDDSPNSYGLIIEKVIDYYNRIRWSKQYKQDI